MRFPILFLILIFTFGSFKQHKVEKVDFLDKIKSYNISYLWTIDSIEIDGGPEKVKRMKPLGYIGKDFQRFYIHFISVTQNPKIPLEYFVKGKSKVKENICDFVGTLTISESKVYKESENARFKEGFVKGNYIFKENLTQKHVGIFEGNFQTDFYIDQNNDLKYNTLTFISDGFANNQFEGNWKSYDGKITQKCNWDDYRIPDSDSLDFGAGQFSPLEKFVKNGWQNYSDAYLYNLDSEKSKMARKKENEEWWK